MNIVHVDRHTQSKKVNQLTGKIVDFMGWIGIAWKRVCDFAWMEGPWHVLLRGLCGFVFLENFFFNPTSKIEDFCSKLLVIFFAFFFFSKFPF